MTTICNTNNNFDSNYKKLREFLNKHNIKSNPELKGKKNTHTEISSKYSNTFCIEDEELEDFINLYSQVVVSSLLSKKKCELNILERVRDITPFLLDIDFTYKTSEKRLYDERHILYVLKNFRRVTGKFFEPYEKKKLFAYLLEKPVPCPDIKDGEIYGYRDGFHITLPYFMVKTDVFKNILIELGKIISNFDNEENPFKELQDHIIMDKSNKIIDTTIPTNNWYMYYSQKPNGYRYILTKKYDGNLNSYDITNSAKNITDLIKRMSIRNKYNDQLVPLKKNLEKINQNQNQNKNQNTKKKDNLDDLEDLDSKTYSDDTTKSPPKIQKLKTQTQAMQRRNDYMKPETMASLLVPLLNDERASSYETWRDVGFALHHTSDKLFPVFDKFSQKDKAAYKKGGGSAGCKKFWDKIKPVSGSCLSIASIFLWAKTDNIKGYRLVLRQQLSKLFDDAANCSDISIARITYNLYRYEYVCASIDNNVWYQFRGHRWECVEAGYTLFDKINVELTNYFAEKQNSLVTGNINYDVNEELLDRRLENQDNEDADDNMAADLDTERLKTLSKIILKLHDSTFVEKVMKVCRKLMYREKFMDSLDENRLLLCFDNGVYDLRTQSFRNGTPDDMCSKTTGYSYPTNYNIKKKKIQKIAKYFEQVLPKPEVREYFLKLVASFIDGNNPHQKFYISTGRGGAGKTQTLNFILAAFGEYAGVLPITLLTKESKGAGSAQPELMDIKGKRFILFSEPEYGDKIYVGLLKRITGDEKIKARGLYEKNLIEFFPQAKYMLLCNEDLPDIQSTDTGIWRRMNVIPWIAQFLASQDVRVINGVSYYRGKPLTEFQHLRDPKLPEQMKTWHKALMWWLLNVWYPKYLEHFEEPDEVTKHSRQYEKDSNVHLDFVESTYTVTGLPEDKISIKDFITEFKTWLNLYNSSAKIKANRKDIENFIKRWENPQVKIYKDYIIGLAFSGNIDLDDSEIQDYMKGQETTKMNISGEAIVVNEKVNEEINEEINEEVNEVNEEVDEVNSEVDKLEELKITKKQSRSRKLTNKKISQKIESDVSDYSTDLDSSKSSKSSKSNKKLIKNKKINIKFCSDSESEEYVEDY